MPTELKGTVRLNVSDLQGLSVKGMGYETLAVFVKNDREEYHSHPVQGRYILEEEYLVFTPSFPFEKGLTYIVRTKKAYTESYSYQPFVIGKKEVIAPAQVNKITPTGDKLPENLLRWYIYFSTPMQKGQALKHIRLIDSAGEIDHHAFMEFKQELWSPDGKRLTILFDPGRIKRGVSTNLELGPALQEGKQYQFVISRAWEDVYGQPLSTDTKKDFMVVKAYRQQIDVDKWEIQEPEVKSKEPLSLLVDRVMDYALIPSMMQIEDEEKNVVAGQWDLFEGERLLQFLPEKIWQKGKYQIKIDSRLEDVAGNNLKDLLDHKLTDANNTPKAHHYIDFNI